MQIFNEIIEIFDLRSVIFFILASLVAYFLYRRTRTRRLPRYVIRSNTLVTDSASKITSQRLQFLFNGNPIDNLTISYLAFWNAGNKTIRNEDVSSQDPFSIYVNEYRKILDVRILYDDKLNVFKPKFSSDKSIRLDFEYIKKDEGIVLEVHHTGKSSEDIKLRGTLKENDKLRKMVFPLARTSKKSRFVYWTFGIIMTTMYILLMTNLSKFITFEFSVLPIISITMITLLVIFMWITIIAFTDRVVPKKLEKFLYS